MRDDQSMREGGYAADPFASAAERLFPALRHRKLAQALDALAGGRIDLAESLVSQVLERRPADASALNLMADIRRRATRFDEAERLTAQCVEQEPQSPGYRFNYAVILRCLGKFEDALLHLDKLLASDQHNPLFREQKAKVLNMTGRHADALVLREELAKEYPQTAQVWLDYGASLRAVGDPAMCIAAYRKAAQLAPLSPTPYLRLSDLKTYRLTEDDVAHMELQLVSPGLSVEDRANLYFALGKAYGDQRLYAKSFSNYSKGNALRRLSVDANAERLEIHRANCESLFTRKFFSDRDGWGANSRAPIFIVGLPRSGTTLVEQILSSHSAVEGLGEISDLETMLFRMLSQSEDNKGFMQSRPDSFQRSAHKPLQEYTRFIRGLDSEICEQLGNQYLQMTGARRKQDKPFFTDKALSNFGHVGYIHLILPKAKIIDVRRHPLDCGWSCFINHFPNGMPFSYRLADIGHHYANYVGLLSYFETALPSKVHRIFYEKLVSDPETEIRRVCSYLEIPFEEQCLRFHENKRVVTTLSSEQVRTPLYKDGIGQWRPYSEWLGPLKAALGKALDAYPEKTA